MLNQKRLVYKFIIPFFCILSFLAAKTKPALALTWYVSPSGNDRWSGTLAVPDAANSDGPFATLERARDVIRKLKLEEGLKESATVLVRGGKYFQDHTIVFTAQDSGTSEFPISLSSLSRGEANSERSTKSHGLEVIPGENYSGIGARRERWKMEVSATLLEWPTADPGEDSQPRPK